jgi:hypothetical protein
MSAEAEQMASDPTDPCPLCGVAVVASVPRCGSCGFDLAGVGGRPGPFTRAVFWWTAMGFIAVYLVTLAIVAFTR